MYAQLKGTIDFMLGDQGWDKFERNDRGSRETDEPGVEDGQRRAA